MSDRFGTEIKKSDMSNLTHLLERKWKFGVRSWVYDLIAQERD